MHLGGGPVVEQLRVRVNYMPVRPYLSSDAETRRPLLLVATRYRDQQEAYIPLSTSTKYHFVGLTSLQATAHSQVLASNNSSSLQVNSTCQPWWHKT